MNVSLALENFTMSPGETQDFKVTYAFTYDYFDTTPLEPSSTIGYKVLQRFANDTLGL